MRSKLQKLFYPKSIAIIGASDREASVGHALISNIIDSSYSGAYYPVNLKHASVKGLMAYRSVMDILNDIDLAIIATPAKTVAGIVIDCGRKGIEAVVIVSAGFKEAGNKGMAMHSQILKNARKFNIRIIGPNCLGFLNTSNDLNASFASRMALPGNIAFLSQSGALCTSILDWSVTQNVGFSHLVSIGSMIDVDFSDLIDFFGTDPTTSCILIYMESLNNAREFMSAARAYARSKPILVLKAGKSDEGAQAALSHTGSLAGNDLVFDAAFRRAGVIRVDTIAQLFHCAQALSMQTLPKGNRLAIVTNAGGPGILATDYLISHGGRLPSLSPKIVASLSRVLSHSWSRKNPIDILGDATPDHYGAAIRACIEDDGIDGILVILSPQDVTDAKSVAQVVANVVRDSKKPILASWMGEADVYEGREVLEANKIPNYRFPERAVYVFLKIYSYFKHIKLLYELTPSTPSEFIPDRDKASILLDKIIAEGRWQLNEGEAKKLLSYYKIPVNLGKVVRSESEATRVATEIGFPLVMKIASPDLGHKTEVGGVILNIESVDAVRDSYHHLLTMVKKKVPNAKIEGVLIERMVKKGMELLIGANKDRLFGPVILFGMGGIAVEIFKDRSIELPPLNMALAKRLIEKTTIYELLKGYRNLPPVDLSALQFIICKFTYLVMDFPQIKSIDINPFVIDSEGGIVLDALVVLDDEAPEDMPDRPYHHLVISPYPSQYEKEVFLKNGQQITLRPIRPEDEQLEAGLFERLSQETIYFRFFGYAPKPDHALLSRFTHIDYDREMAIVAIVKQKGELQMIGVVRIIADPWNERAEYAIVVADEWQGQGLGTMLTDYIIEIAKNRGIKILEADVMVSNTRMTTVFSNRGFAMHKGDPGELHVVLEL